MSTKKIKNFLPHAPIPPSPQGEVGIKYFKSRMKKNTTIFPAQPPPLHMERGPGGEVSKRSPALRQNNLQSVHRVPS